MICSVYIDVIVLPLCTEMFSVSLELYLLCYFYYRITLSLVVCLLFCDPKKLPYKNPLLQNFNPLTTTYKIREILLKTRQQIVFILIRQLTWLKADLDLHNLPRSCKYVLSRPRQVLHFKCSWTVMVILKYSISSITEYYGVSLMHINYAY